MSRPYMQTEDFMKYREFLEPALVNLKEEYTDLIRKRRGVIAIHHIDKYVFPKVKSNANIETVEQEHVLEAFFDAFCGTITMFGSDYAFDILERQIKGELPLC
jgi:hypothetical protein